MPPSRMFRGIRIPMPRNINVAAANRLLTTAVQADTAPQTPDASGIPISPITPFASQAAAVPQTPDNSMIPVSPITPVVAAGSLSVPDTDAQLPDATVEDLPVPLTPLGKSSARLAAQLANPPYYTIFHLHFLCACGKHLTPGPKTSLKIKVETDEDIVNDTLVERFNVEIETQTLIYGDSTTGVIEPCYDGLRAIGEYGIVKVILHDQKREMQVLEKSVDRKGNPIAIWEDVEESHFYQGLDDIGGILNVCPCKNCVENQNEELYKDDMEQDRSMLFSDDIRASEDDDWLQAELITRSSISRAAERILADSTPEPFSSSPLDNEGEMAMEDLNWDIESVVDDDSDEEDLRDERQAVWTNRARHPQPVSTPLNTTPPAKISRMPSEEEWARASKRMRMMR
ncbi:hypothetical protein E6O75_ATG04034 [Venturia nashicola]|uniref:Uncharacterized protein n=1 Tax=Venturia nashicola TaxID=86259 RepID=A0A4Z1PBX2_9PEZI|nr:hypothetical protein E6O75_ATG04034 [Venturia nashicola]